MDKEDDRVWPTPFRQLEVTNEAKIAGLKNDLLGGLRKGTSGEEDKHA
jgi:hypothetical protein